MKQKFQEQVALDMERLARANVPVQLILSPQQGWMLIAQLQLALRHPGNAGAASKYARELADLLIDALAQSPALRELARRGDNPAYDE